MTSAPHTPRHHAPRHFLSFADWSAQELLSIIHLAGQMKKYPSRYSSALAQKKLLMIFAKPSLRTRLSFEVSMLELGGHAIFYDISTSPMGKKESVEDTARVSSLYVDAIMARLYEHRTIETFAAHSSVPVINGLTNMFHPCQILSDFMTIKELFGNFRVKLAFVGDGYNNIPHSLMELSAKLGAEMVVACPMKKGFMPDVQLVRATGVKLMPMAKAVRDSDIIYADSWQSYQIKDAEMKKRRKILAPYQVNSKTFNPRAYFMHDLPARRGEEVTADIIDGSRSVVLQQAENRKHIEKALLYTLLKVIR